MFCICVQIWHLQTLCHVNSCMSKQRPALVCVPLNLLLSLWSSAAESIVNTLTHLSSSLSHTGMQTHCVNINKNQYYWSTIQLLCLAEGAQQPVMPSCITLFPWREMAYLILIIHPSTLHTVCKTSQTENHRPMSIFENHRALFLV